MDTSQQRDMLRLMQTLTDETKLNIVRIVAAREHSAAELSDLLETAEETTKDILKQMHSLGLLSVRMVGKQIFFRLNQKRMRQFRAYITELHLPLEDQPQEVSPIWLDELDWTEDDKKVLREHIFNGRLMKMPLKMKKEAVIMRWLASKFEPGIRYPEHQVNAILTEIHEDYATLRRGLVEYGLMERERGGGPYWRADAASEGIPPKVEKPLTTPAMPDSAVELLPYYLD